MPKVVVRNFACSLDGFGAGLQQSQSEPFGKNAMQIMNWFFPTRTFKAMRGVEGGTTGLDDSYAARSFEGVGASIMGRNMFSPLRGPWANEEGKTMSVKRMDNVLSVVDDLEATKAFFIELGLKLEGETIVEGPAVGSLIGL